MAALEFTSREQEEVFRLLVLLNGSLQFIARRLEELSASKILSPEYIKDTISLTQKVQEYVDKKSHS